MVGVSVVGMIVYTIGKQRAYSSTHLYRCSSSYCNDRVQEQAKDFEKRYCFWRQIWCNFPYFQEVEILTKLELTCIRKHFYWELVQCARKLGIVLARVLTDPLFQCVCGIIVLFISLQLQVKLLSTKLISLDLFPTFRCNYQ